MAFEFKFPDVGEGIHEGRVVEWLVKEGDAVRVDQPLVKVETDKAVVELPSPRAGTILRIVFPKGEIIRVGQAFVLIGEAGEQAGAPRPGPALGVPAQPESGPPAQAAAPPAPSAAALRPLATPHTRAYARKIGVDLTMVAGSGKGGRITDEDVDRAASAPAASHQGPGPAVRAPLPAVPEREPRPEPSQPSAGDSGPVERVPVTHLRKLIADNMARSKQTSAHVTHVDEADVTDLVALHRRVRTVAEADGKTRLTILPFFLKAVAAALQDHPLLNASYDEERSEVVLKKYYNLGIAVDTPEGLVVPVVRDVDRKGIVALSREVADLAQRARERRLSLEELRQGSFTVTNIGPIGGLFATPIIRQPELAIVGLHTIKERPAVVDGAIAIRKMMHLSVSFDHRIIDGAEAARFMSDLVRIVSNPDLLFLRL